MASPGRSWRGRRGHYRGGLPRRGPPRGPPPRDREMPAPPDDLDSRELEAEGKKIVIEVKSNEQGRFFKIIERQSQGPGRGRVIFSVETGQTFRPILDSLVAEHERLGPNDENASSERLKTENFSQGRRRFYVDLRQNPRGRFLKLTQLTPGGRTFVAIPGDGLLKFQEMFCQLLDEFGSSDYSPPGSPQEQLPSSREVRAGSKSFFFDVERNDRGVYVRLTEVLRNYGRRTHINVPHSCWSRMSEVFSQLNQEIPYDAGSASGSGSEDN